MFDAAKWEKADKWQERLAHAAKSVRQALRILLKKSALAKVSLAGKLLFCPAETWDGRHFAHRMDAEQSDAA
jgi:hypothetical protein